MYTGRLVFAQVMDLLPIHEFRKCVRRYQGDYKVRGFSCLDQFLCMAFAQLTYRESLRDIESCLRAMAPRLYHMGIRGRISRSTLADANETRDWRIYGDFAKVLIEIARPLYLHEEFGVRLKQPAYALDATTIDLCLSLFPWAHFHHHKAAIKLHTLINLRGSIPEFVYVSDARTYELIALDLLLFQPGAFYVMDRAYTDFERLYRIHQASAFFVIRAKNTLDVRRCLSHSVDTTTGLRSDQIVYFNGRVSSARYPERLRRVSFFDAANHRHLVFLTNNFSVSPLTIAQLYKARWRIEIFFKWIKQHLRIKAFFGTSPNAVKTQVWIAVSVYVLVAILKKRLKLNHNLYTILQVLSISQFEREPLYDLLSQQLSILPENTSPSNQLTFFNL